MCIRDSLDGANYIDEHVDEGLLVLCESICDISVLPAGNLATSLVRRVNPFPAPENGRRAPDARRSRPWRVRAL